MSATGLPRYLRRVKARDAARGAAGSGSESRCRRSSVEGLEQDGAVLADGPEPCRRPPQAVERLRRAAELLLPGRAVVVEQRAAAASGPDVVLRASPDR